MLDKKTKDWAIKASKKYGMPHGMIACPTCGTVSYGLIEPECPFCERFYWSIAERENG